MLGSNRICIGIRWVRVQGKEWKTGYECNFCHDSPRRYYLLCLLVVLLGMSVVHFTVISYGTAPVYSVLLYLITFFVVIGVNIAAWTGFVWVKLIVSAEDFGN